MKILITDVCTRKAFDTISGLRRHFKRNELLLAAHKDAGIQLPLVYGQKIHTLDKSSAAAFNHSLNTILDLSAEPLVYMPVEEDTTLLVYQYLNQYPQQTKLRCLLPASDAFHLARDKDAIARFAQTHGLPIPKRFTAANVAELQQQFMPVIIKPKTGTGSEGLIFIETRNELHHLDGLDFEANLVQEKIEHSHEVHGAFFLFSDGQMVDYYGHQRIRTYPVKGGVTVYSRTQYNEQVREQGRKLLEHLQWNGVAMVEYLYSPKDGEYKLIEVNPRLWGSILLSEKAETALLKNYVLLAAGQPASAHLPLLQPRFIRWLFPFDILNYIKTKGKIRGFWHFNTKNTCYIGFTYAGSWRSIAFLFYQTFNFGSLRKFLKKTRA